MRRGAVWLSSALSDGVTGGRFIAREWDDTAASQVAAAGARSKSCEAPIIM
jgi:3-oxoacyl-[acyl-carrier protein] reductase